MIRFVTHYEKRTGTSAVQLPIRDSLQSALHWYGAPSRRKIEMQSKKEAGYEGQLA